MSSKSANLHRARAVKNDEFYTRYEDVRKECDNYLSHFFNKTIYFKNITLYWPIWGLYLLCLLLSGPAMLWLCLREEAINPSMNQAAAQLELICSFADLTWVLITSIIIAILTAMALFNYLSVSKNANMIHAFPVTRLELFGTNLLSGITFLFVPQLITFMINV